MPQAPGLPAAGSGRPLVTPGADGPGLPQPSPGLGRSNSAPTRPRPSAQGPLNELPRRSQSMSEARRPLVNNLPTANPAAAPTHAAPPATPHAGGEGEMPDGEMTGDADKFMGAQRMMFDLQVAQTNMQLTTKASEATVQLTRG